MAVIGSDDRTSALAGPVGKFSHCVRCPSTRMPAAACHLSYLSYAYLHGSWANPTLGDVSLFAGGALPGYAKLGNKAELWANNQVGFITGGRLGRFIPQFAFNLAVFRIMQLGGALNRDGVASVGGIASAALMTSLASQGIQYLGVYRFQRGMGDVNRNVLVGLSATVVLTAFGTVGLLAAHVAVLLAGVGFGLVLFAIGLLSGIRPKVAPKGGVGMLFGLLNPFDNTHLATVRSAIEPRRPDRVEAAFYREIYDANGFKGVVAEIKRRHLSATSMAGSTHGARCAATACRQRRSVAVPRTCRGAKGMTRRRP